MRNIILKILIVWCAEMGFACVLTAQVNHRLTQAQRDSIVNPPLREDASGILLFEKNVIRLDTLTEDDAPVTLTFSFTNKSKQPIWISKVTTNCGCTVADFSKAAVNGGEKGHLTLTYVPKNHPGTVDTNAFIYLKGYGSRPVAKLTLLGMVLPGKDAWSRFPYAMGKLRLKRKTVEFEEVKPGQMPSERILCGNSGNVPLKPTALLLPSFASFRSEPETIAPGGEADLVITVDESKIPKVKGDSFTFPVILDGINSKPSDRTITVRVNRTK